MAEKENKNTYKFGLVAYSTKTGLGYQTRLLYKLLKPTKVLIYDLSRYNGMELDHSWCTVSHRITNGFPNIKDLNWFLDGIDKVFVCESPLDYNLFWMARDRGIRSIQQYNYEFFDYFRNPLLTKPDVLASPSMWGINHVKRVTGITPVLLPLPIEGGETCQLHYQTGTITHIAGRPTFEDRNGTLDFLNFVEQYQNDYLYKLYYQSPTDERSKKYFKPLHKKIVQLTKKVKNLKVFKDVENNKEMYKKTDLLLLPRRYGGLCLPMLEALENNIPVCMPNISPNYSILPHNWLFESELYKEIDIATKIAVYKSKPEDIKKTIDQVFSTLTKNQLHAFELKNSLSFDNLKDLYYNI